MDVFTVYSRGSSTTSKHEIAQIFFMSDERQCICETMLPTLLRKQNSSFRLQSALQAFNSEADRVLSRRAIVSARRSPFAFLAPY